MGIDHKTMLKPALRSFADEIKKVSMVKQEECISYQQKSGENAARLEGKRNQLAAVQLRIDQVSALSCVFGGVCHLVWTIVQETSFHLFYECE